jgi:hypothetical protein
MTRQIESVGIVAAACRGTIANMGTENNTPHGSGEETKKPQHRCSLDEDVFEILKSNAPTKGKHAVSKFANECLRAFFRSANLTVKPNEGKG